MATRPAAYWLHQSKAGACLAITLSAVKVDRNGRPARWVSATDVSALRAARLENKSNCGTAQELSQQAREVRNFADMRQIQHGPALPADATRLLELLKQSAQQMHRSVSALEAG